MDDKIKIGLVDDHTIFRKGVILSMRQYDKLNFMLEASNGEALLYELSESTDNLPDIILCDLKMPKRDGIDVTKTIAKLYPSIRVIILTMYDDDRFVSHLMDAGAAGYLLKNTDPAEIYKAINEVSRTGYYLTAFVNKVLIKRMPNKHKFIPSLNSEIVLTEKEREILLLTAMEFTAAEIADKITASPRTVEAIKDRLMERFGVKNSVGLVFFAMKNKLIEG
jgi:DNA-binding NarL/FixJ family response regulator